MRAFEFFVSKSLAKFEKGFSTNTPAKGVEALYVIIT